MNPDLTDLRRDIESGDRSAPDLFSEALAAADAEPNRRTFVRRFDVQGRLAASAVDALRAAGGPLPPLGGLAVSIKDLFDVAGFPTTAGSLVLADQPPATTDCPAVARLRQAGAALIGHTNMTEFAYSGVGINPHHGTPANAATTALDREPRIPGGSSSGAAVSVATGAAHAALGSDTGGSIRIPAALQGLVGFKNTTRLTPTEGAIPLSTTLDTACAITRSVRDAVLLHALLADRPVALTRRPIGVWRFGVPQASLLDGLDPTVAAAFDRTLETLSRAGALIEIIPLAPLAALPALMAGGGFSPVEAWAWHRARLATDERRYDPRVAARMRRGESMSAADYIDLQRGRMRWIGAMTAAMQGFDALLSPTVPIVAPRIADLAPGPARDDAFFAANALLLRNPSVVNMLDGCALSLPCHRPDEMPVGLMVWSTALADDTVLDASLAIEAALRRGRLMRVAVIGAGIVGVTTAYELAIDGHEVAVFERNGSVAAGASFANAGLVAAGRMLPWAASGGLRGALAAVYGDHPPVRAGSKLRALAWAWRQRRAPTLADDAEGFGALSRLAAFSQERLHDITRRLHLDYERAEGVLVLLRTAADQVRAETALQALVAADVRHSLLDRDGCRRIEPGLHAETALHGGVWLPDGEAGNCRQFATLLRGAAQRLGVRFRYHTDVQQVLAGRQPQIVRIYAPPDEPVIATAANDQRPSDDIPTRPMPFEAVTETFDAVVVCAAAESARLLVPLGTRLPVTATFGYSITAPIRHDEHHPERPPRAAVIDQQMQVAISRIGARIRVAGITEIGAARDRHDQAALETLYKVLHDWFPGVARLPHALPWKGVRPTLPDRRPVIGRSATAGVWLNLGHGAHGWALACGSARLLADALAGRDAAIDGDPFGIGRFAH